MTTPTCLMESTRSPLRFLSATYTMLAPHALARYDDDIDRAEQLYTASAKEVPPPLVERYSWALDARRRRRDKVPASYATVTRKLTCCNRPQWVEAV